MELNFQLKPDPRPQEKGKGSNKLSKSAVTVTKEMQLLKHVERSGENVSRTVPER
jgi:hypothetical protein